MKRSRRCSVRAARRRSAPSSIRGRTTRRPRFAQPPEPARRVDPLAPPLLVLLLHHQNRPPRRLRHPAPARRATLLLVKARRPRRLEPPPPRVQRVPRHPRDTPELSSRQPRPPPRVQDQQPLLAAQRRTLDLQLRLLPPTEHPVLPPTRQPSRRLGLVPLACDLPLIASLSLLLLPTPNHQLLRRDPRPQLAEQPRHLPPAALLARAFHCVRTHLDLARLSFVALRHPTLLPAASRRLRKQADTPPIYRLIRGRISGRGTASSRGREDWLPKRQASRTPVTEPHVWRMTEGMAILLSIRTQRRNM